MSNRPLTDRVLACFALTASLAACTVSGAGPEMALAPTVYAPGRTGFQTAGAVSLRCVPEPSGLGSRCEPLETAPGPIGPVRRD